MRVAETPRWPYVRALLLRKSKSSSVQGGLWMVCRQSASTQTDGGPGTVPILIYGLLPTIRLTASSAIAGINCPGASRPTLFSACCKVPARSGVFSALWTCSISPEGLAPTNITPWLNPVTVQPPAFKASTSSEAKEQGSGCPPTHETLIAP